MTSNGPDILQAVTQIACDAIQDNTNHEKVNIQSGDEQSNDGYGYNNESHLLPSSSSSSTGSMTSRALITTAPSGSASTGGAHVS
jgi:hypothetical protein